MAKVLYDKCMDLVSGKMFLVFTLFPCDNVKSESNKDVGTAKVTIAAKGAGKGSVSASFRIIPKKTPISKLTAKSKGFTVNWKKIGGCADGYQIQTALNKTFTSGVKTK